MARTTDITHKLDELLQGRKLEELPDEALEIIIELQQEEVYRKAAECFYTYVKLMAPEVIPEGYIDGKHIRYICSKLQKVEEGKIPRLQIFLPPGAMKSKLASQLFPSWCFGRDAASRIIAVGHSTKFAEDNFGRPVKDLMSTETYAKVFPSTTIRTDVRAAGRWTTDQGGTYYATGAGAALAGRRAKIAILDDVLSEQEAMSDIEREKVNDWYGPGLRTRLLPNGAEIIINTRWHIDDISGRTLSEAEANPSTTQWEVISFPAILEEDDPDAQWIVKNLPGFKFNDSFWPELWPVERLREIQADPSMTPQKFAALYQQKPVLEDGNILKEEYFADWERPDPPPCDFILISTDTAFSTKTTADFSAYTVWGIFTRMERLTDGREMPVQNMIMLAAKKGRWEFPDLCQEINKAFKEYVADIVIIEKKASGQSLIQEMRRRGLPVYEYLPDTDKVSRCHATTPIMQAGRIHAPKIQNWAKDVILECTQFPQGRNDDYVDTVTQAVIWMRDSWRLNHPDDWEDDVDQSTYKRGRRTYWSSGR
jgi:predicted phage terminase large subunit-like protein